MDHKDGRYFEVEEGTRNAGHPVHDLYTCGSMVCGA